jgi:cellulose synthase/poly-beta-1,6-N-acetylglucosamine synthase-like glycosyltransferase
LQQKYPHDTWVADEDPSEEDMVWYEKHGVKVSSRKDHPEYHNETWPRRKKSKEGNLRFFHDHYGYENYDVIVHLDADHIPHADYLEHMLRPFNDSKVGYVAAPSVCDLNAATSWAARARMHVEAIFHGPIQSGSNDGWVPICIGSHYAVRSTALKAIGGIGPELAEDYSTTLLFNASGWKGVWVYDAKARGEGPHSFVDIIVQDYQWARSLVVIFLTLFPKVVHRLNLRQKIQFIFTQLWYPIGACVWAFSIFLISHALISGRPPVTMVFTNFLWFIALPLLLTLSAYFVIRNRGFMRPEYGNVLTWENILFELARWPWIVIATLDALVSTIFFRKHNYHVTPKGGASDVHVSIAFLIPYLVVATLLVYSIVSWSYNFRTFGYLIFAIVMALAYIVLTTTVIWLHIKEIRSENEKKIKHVYKHVPHLFSTLVLAFSLVLVVWVTFRNYPVAVPSLDEIISHTANTVVREVSQKENSSDLTPATSTVSDTSTYVVESGDSLWKISERLYGQGELWTVLYEANSEQIFDPDFIVPGQILLVR